MSDVVYIQVGKRRKIHRAVRVGSVLLTAEGCNIDASGNRQEIGEGEARALIAGQPALACGRCVA